MFFAVHFSCNAQEGEFGKSTAAERLETECGFDLGERIKRAIASEKVSEINLNSMRYVNIEFQINLNILKKKTTARISFNCAIDGKITSNSNSPTPAQLIRQQDVAGRYFRHVAWQRKIAGNNWRGLIAYSDYLFGDGQKSETYSYFICLPTSQCFGYEVDPEVRLTSQEREIAIRLIEGVSRKK